MREHRLAGAPVVNRAQAVYRRAGFVATDKEFTGPTGLELAMSRALRRL